ncbi:hypothetical protein BJY00DRAFT_307658 [Aspergillus carlsbadensis]|nr:hypothetical protein BJY00DRAFT_307658 [Aspergillus carlsbadensis]
MDDPTHIIDPNGEVIIVLRNANMRPNTILPKKVQPPRTLKSPLVEGDNQKGDDEETTGTDGIGMRENLEHFSTAGEADVAEAAEKQEDVVEQAGDNALQTEKSPSPTEDRTTEVYRIQVSAKHLILASPVLENLLTGGWRENMTLLEKGSVEVTAESWDLEALLITLRIIHGKTSYVPREITLEMFAKIAMVVDYYECSEAMRIAADLWISKLPQCPSNMCRDLVFWIWISWVFRL